MARYSVQPRDSVQPPLKRLIIELLELLKNNY